jgi:hypothetical protein
VRELRQANEILRKASAYFVMRCRAVRLALLMKQMGLAGAVRGKSEDDAQR